MIHYHGTPLTPRSALYTMAGKHFCVSFANPRDAEVCQQIGQSVLWDNGAFSLFTQDKKVDWSAYYKWLEPRLGHPHWAVIPDVIDGGERDNNKLISEWPFPYELSAPVWHLDEPVARLLRLALSFRRLCFGSSGKYWQVGSLAWERRCDEAFNALAKEGGLPWVHMMRGLGLGGKRWPFASADSVNVATSHSRLEVSPEYMAREIDAVQCPIVWNARPEQTEFAA
tara:strand:+ start:91 stop:768 length:678 start_codon:yes stop_codon:yes gene_type:complete